jgi:uncharacterized protein
MIIDTGILYALADRDDRHHQAALEVLRSPEVRVVPEPAVAEADWLILEYLGVEAEAGFLESLAEGTLSVECPTRADRARAAGLVRQYTDLKIGYVDAATVAIAERIGERRIATVDRRHFSAIRPRHVDWFELLP